MRFPAGLNMPGGILVIVPFTEPVLLPVVVIGPAIVVPGGTLIMLPGGNVPVLLLPGGRTFVGGLVGVPPGTCRPGKKFTQLLT